MVVHDKVEGAQAMHLAMQGPPLWVSPHQVVRPLIPESGPQCILQAFPPCNKILDPSQVGAYLENYMSPSMDTNQGGGKN